MDWFLSNDRIANGTAISFGDVNMKGIYPHFHWSKDPMFSMHMSQIVPKGSPLQVK